MTMFVREIGVNAQIVRHLGVKGIETVDYLVRILDGGDDAFRELKERMDLPDLQAVVLLERLVKTGSLPSSMLNTIPASLRSSPTPAREASKKEITALRRKLARIQNRITRAEEPLEDREYFSLRRQERQVVERLMNLGAW